MTDINISNEALLCLLRKKSFPLKYKAELVMVVKVFCEILHKTIDIKECSTNCKKMCFRHNALINYYKKYNIDILK